MVLRFDLSRLLSAGQVIKEVHQGQIPPTSQVIGNKFQQISPLLHKPNNNKDKGQAPVSACPYYLFQEESIRT